MVFQNTHIIMEMDFMQMDLIIAREKRRQQAKREQARREQEERQREERRTAVAEKETQRREKALFSAVKTAMPKAVVTQTNMLAMIESFDKEVMALVDAVENAADDHKFPPEGEQTSCVISENAKQLILDIMLFKELIKRRKYEDPVQEFYGLQSIGRGLKKLVSMYSDDTEIFHGSLDDDSEEGILSFHCTTLKIWRLTLDVKVSFIKLKEATREWEESITIDKDSNKDNDKDSDEDTAAAAAQPPPAKRICE